MPAHALLSELGSVAPAGLVTAQAAISVLSATPRNVMDPTYGAIGDGTLHPLSERYSTLGAAQAFYPAATALTDSIDWAAIQKAENGRHTLLPDCAGYVLNKPLVLSIDSRLEGVGQDRTILRNATTDLFTWSTSTRLISMHNLQARSLAGGGHIFAPTGNLSRARFEFCTFDQDNAGKSIFDNGGTAVIDTHWENNEYWMNSAATVPAFNWIAGNGLLNANRFKSSRMNNAGNTNGIPFFVIDCTGIGSYQYDNTFEDLTCEVMMGGFIELRGCRGTRLHGVINWDYTSAATNDFIVLTVGSGTSLPCTNTVIENCSRRMASGGSIGAFKDIRISSGGAANTTIQNVEHATNTGYAIELGGTRCTMIGDFSGATITGNTAGRVTTLSPRSVLVGEVSVTTPGAVTSQNIHHGLGVVPAMYSVTPANSNARNSPNWSAAVDDTNIIITYASALTAGFTYSWAWMAKA